MKRICLIVFMLVCIANRIESVDVSPIDVCTNSRTKDSFCNDNATCTGSRVILCAGNHASQAITYSCGSNSLCQARESGDFCSDTCGSDTSSTNADFTCSGLGYFPNPYDCTSYYFCSLSSDKLQYVANIYKCPNGNVFSPNSATYCTRKNNVINNCITADCGSSNTTKYIQLQYGFNKQYFALCEFDSDQPSTIVYVFACPTNSLPNLSANIPKCAYSCWRAGFFQNSLDKSKYFECFWNNSLRLESIERRCPSGASFDTSSSRCKVDLSAAIATQASIRLLNGTDSSN